MPRHMQREGMCARVRRKTTLTRKRQVFTRKEREIGSRDTDTTKTGEKTKERKVKRRYIMKKRRRVAGSVEHRDEKRIIFLGKGQGQLACMRGRKQVAPSHVLGCDRKRLAAIGTVSSCSRDAGFIQTKLKRFVPNE